MVRELQSSSNNFTLVKGDSKFTASSALKRMQIKFKQTQHKQEHSKHFKMLVLI